MKTRYDICRKCHRLAINGTSERHIQELHCWWAYRHNALKDGTGFDSRTFIGNLVNNTFKHCGNKTFKEINADFENLDNWKFKPPQTDQFETPKECPYNLEMTLLNHEA